MIISTPNVEFNIKNLGNIDKGIPLVFLHGFMGSMESWSEVVPHFNIPIILIDLPGHAQSHFKNIEDYTFSDWCSDFKLILDELSVRRINLCGYSMGGRLALSFACEYPQMVNRLILESSTPGIRDEEECNNRAEEDKSNCAKIMNDYPALVKGWSDNQLFKNQRKRNSSGWEVQNRIRLGQNSEQLSFSLQSLGTGQMTSLWGEIKNLQSSTMLLTGSEDSKYCRIATECFQKIPDCKWVNISNCGHNIHLEHPNQFIESIKSFLNT